MDHTESWRGIGITISTATLLFRSGHLIVLRSRRKSREPQHQAQGWPAGRGILQQIHPEGSVPGQSRRCDVHHLGGINAPNVAVAPDPSRRGPDGRICLEAAGNSQPVTSAVRIRTAVAHRSLWNSSFRGNPGTPYPSPSSAGWKARMASCIAKVSWFCSPTARCSTTVHGSCRTRFATAVAKKRWWSQVARCSQGWRNCTA